MNFPVPVDPQQSFLSCQQLTPADVSSAFALYRYLGCNMVTVSVPTGPWSRVWQRGLERAGNGMWLQETPTRHPIVTIAVYMEGEADPVVTVLGPSRVGMHAVEVLQDHVATMPLRPSRHVQEHVASQLPLRFSRISITQKPLDLRPIDTAVTKTLLRETIAYCSTHFMLRFVSEWQDTTFPGAFARRTAETANGTHYIQLQAPLDLPGVNGGDYAAAFVEALQSVLDCGCGTFPVALPIVLPDIKPGAGNTLEGGTPAFGQCNSDAARTRRHTDPGYRQAVPVATVLAALADSSS